MPQRIQRKRTRGWRMPANAVYVGRPTKFGNPFPLEMYWASGFAGGEVAARAWALERYRFWITRGIPGDQEPMPPQSVEIQQLRGRDLACWCPLSSPCHADVLLQLANEEQGQ